MIFVRQLRWNDWNTVHIARHHVTPKEVEEVCHGRSLVEKGYSGRVLLIEPTEAGRVLAVILGPEADDVYYPITARPASRKERQLYRNYMEGDE